jgi:hypothetical protein
MLGCSENVLLVAFCRLCLGASISDVNEKIAQGVLSAEALDNYGENAKGKKVNMDFENLTYRCHNCMMTT